MILLVFSADGLHRRDDFSVQFISHLNSPYLIKTAALNQPSICILPQVVMTAVLFDAHFDVSDVKPFIVPQKAMFLIGLF